MTEPQPVFKKASFCHRKYDHGPFLQNAGQRSRAIIPGDDPGDQQPPEPRGFHTNPQVIEANARPTQISRDRTPV
jgi:hypothetical protein